VNSTFSTNSVNYASVVTRDDRKLYIALVNYESSPKPVNVMLSGDNVLSQGLAHVLTSSSLSDENTFESPLLISPKTTTLQVSNSFVYTMPKYSVSILELQLQ